MTKKTNAYAYVAEFGSQDAFLAHIETLGVKEGDASLTHFDAMRALANAVGRGLIASENAAAEAFKHFATARNRVGDGWHAPRPTEGKDVKSDVSRWNVGVKLAGLVIATGPNTTANAALHFLKEYGARPEYHGAPRDRLADAFRAALKVGTDDKRGLREEEFLKAVGPKGDKLPETDDAFALRLAKTIQDKLAGNPEKGKDPMADTPDGLFKQAAELLRQAAALKGAALAADKAARAKADAEAAGRGRPEDTPSLDAALAIIPGVAFGKASVGKPNGAAAH